MAHNNTRISRKKSNSKVTQSSVSALKATVSGVSTTDIGKLPMGALMLAASVSGWAQSADATKSLSTVTVTEKAEQQQGKDALQTKKTTIGKGTQDIRDIPQSINVVTERLLDEKRIDNLNDALRLTAGVTFSAAENGSMQDIFIRGFSVAQVGDLLIDGMKDASLYERETFNLDRIEVMRGSASMIFGRGSTGGVVNQVNKKPLAVNQSDVDFTVGTGAYKRATGDFNIVTGEDAALRLNVMATNANNYGANIQKYGVAPAYTFGMGTRDEITIGAYYLDYDNTLWNNLPYNTIGSRIDAHDWYGTDSDFSKGTAKYAYLQHTHRFNDGGELRTQARSGNFQRRTWLTQTRFAGTPATWTDSTVITRAGLTPRKDEYDGTYFQSDYSNNFTGLGFKHAVLAGVDFAWEKADRYTQSVAGANKGTTTIGTPGGGYVVREPVFGTTPTGGYDSKSYGVYAQDLVQVAEYWKVLGGLRWDSIKGDFSSTTATNGVTNFNKASMSDNVPSYRFGVLFQPSETASYHFSYSTSFNTSADTYQYVTQQNANTPPEKSRNIELGAKLDWMEGKLSTRAALFRTEKYNERTTDADFAGDAYLLSGKRHSTGLELEIVGRPAPKWETYFSYAYIWDTNIDKAGSAATAQATVGQPFGLVPRHSGSVWATYQATPKLRVGLGMTASSENWSINGTTPTRGARAPGYAVFDAMGEYRFTEDTYLQITAKNLDNRLYAAELYRGFYMPGAGRSVQATVGTRF